MGSSGVRALSQQTALFYNLCCDDASQPKPSLFRVTGKEKGKWSRLGDILYPPQWDAKKINWTHIISQYLKTRSKVWTSWRAEESRLWTHRQKDGDSCLWIQRQSRERRLWSQAEMKTGLRGRKMGAGGGSLRVIAVLHSKFLSIIWIFTLYLCITLIQNI